jgi:hypothetical protein
MVRITSFVIVFFIRLPALESRGGQSEVVGFFFWLMVMSSGLHTGRIRVVGLLQDQL